MIYDKVAATFAPESLPYSREEIEAIVRAIDAVPPAEVRTPPEDYDPEEGDGWVYDTEQLVYNLALWGRACKEGMGLTYPSPSEEARELEAVASRLEKVAKDIRDHSILIDVLRGSTRPGLVDPTSSEHLVATADALREHAEVVRNWRYRKGKRNPALPHLNHPLFLWDCSGRRAGRNKRTADYLELCAVPIWGDHVSPSTVDRVLRNWPTARKQHHGFWD